MTSSRHRTRDFQPPGCGQAGGLLLCLGLLACSDEGRPRPLDKEKPLSQLTLQESLELCGELNELTVGDEEYVEGACSSYGLLISARDASMSCIDAREECRAELEMRSACWLDLQQDGASEDCPRASVGEMVDCMTALVADTKRRYENVSCSDPSSNPPLETAEDTWRRRVRANPPEGCRALLTSCPEFFDDMPEM